MQNRIYHTHDLSETELNLPRLFARAIKVFANGLKKERYSNRIGNIMDNNAISIANIGWNRETILIHLTHQHLCCLRSAFWLIHGCKLENEAQIELLNTFTSSTSSTHILLFIHTYCSYSYMQKGLSEQKHKIPFYYTFVTTITNNGCVC